MNTNWSTHNWTYGPTIAWSMIHFYNDCVAYLSTLTHRKPPLPLTYSAWSTKQTPFECLSYQVYSLRKAELLGRRESRRICRDRMLRRDAAPNCRRRRWRRRRQSPARRPPSRRRATAPGCSNTRPAATAADDRVTRKRRGMRKRTPEKRQKRTKSASWCCCRILWRRWKAKCGDDDEEDNACDGKRMENDNDERMRRKRRRRRCDQSWARCWAHLRRRTWTTWRWEKVKMTKEGGKIKKDWIFFCLSRWHCRVWAKVSPKRVIETMSKYTRKIFGTNA